MATPDKIDQLYDALKADGAVSKSREHFRQYMQDENNRRQLYNALKADGAVSSATYEDFAGKLGYQQRTANSGQRTANSGQRTVDSGQRTVDSGQQRTESQPVQPTQPVQEPEAAQPKAQPKPQPKKKPFRPSAQQYAAMQNLFAQSDAMFANLKQRSANMREWRKQNPLRMRGDGFRLGARQPRVLGGNKNVVRGQDRFNPRTGKMEARYITPSGDEFSSEIQASNFQNRVEHAQYRQEHPLEADMQDAYKERDRLDREIARRTEELNQQNRQREAGQSGMGSFAASLANAEGPGYSGSWQNERVSDPELSMLWTAKRKNEQRIKTLEREKNQDGFWTTLGKTLFSVDTWDFGAQELRDAGNLAMYGDMKLPKGAHADAQEAMMRNTYLQQVADQQWGENDTFMQRAGEITANAIPFVVEFIATGGFSGITAAGTKAGTKAAAKIATGKVGNWIIKNTGTLAGDMAAGFMMANTTGAMKTGADVLNRHLGYVVMDENGEYKFEGGKSWGRSIYEGEMANTLEYYTEKLGAHLDGSGKVIGGWIGKGMERIGAGRVSELFSRITGGEWAGVLRKGGIQDYPAEVVEEQANLLMSALLVGDNNFSLSPIKAMWDGDIDKESDEYKKSIFNPKTQADIWGGMLLSIGFMQSLGVGYQTAQYYRYKHKTDVSDKVASFRFTPERWEPLRERIDGTTNENMRDVITDIINDQDMRVEEKKAALGYVKNLMKMRGYNLRTNADAKDKLSEVDEAGNPTADDQQEQAIDQAYGEGYNLQDVEGMQDAKNVMELRRGVLEEFVSEEFLAQLDGDPVAALRNIQGYDTWTDDERQAAMDYVNAKATYDGMMQRVRDDIESEIAASDAMVDSRIAKPEQGGDGMIHPATMKIDDRAVYIVSGTVQMLEDGSMVDTEHSDQDLIIVDAATGKMEMVSVHDFKGVADALDAEQVREEAREEIRQRLATEASNRIDGTLAFQPGDVYELPWSGRDVTFQIVEDLGNGNVSVIADGADEPIELPKETLQAMADERNQARAALNAAAQDDEQSPAARSSDEGVESSETPETELPPTFLLNDYVTLQTPDGEVRGSVTAEENEDGLIEVFSEQPINGKRINLFTPEELSNMVVEHSPAARSSNEGVESSESDEERIIHDGITGLADGLREAMGASTSIRENDINNWLQHPEVASVMQQYGAGAQTAEEIVERALADNPGEEVKQALNDILRFDSSKQILSNYVSEAPVAENEMQPADESYSPAARSSEDGVESSEPTYEAASQPMSDDEASGESAVEPMPMVEVRGKMRPDWASTTPDRAHHYIYDERGLSRDNADAFVKNNIDATEKAIEKLRKKEPKMGIDLDEFDEQHGAWQSNLDELQRQQDYWRSVRMAQDARLAAERREQEERDRAAHDAAVAAEEQRQAEDLVKRAEQAERGAHAVHPAIRERWDAAEKIEGFENEITLPNGERVQGRYMLVESGAATPSHNATMDFARSEGFPVDDNGNTINDRDYERDKDAQDITREMGRTYDSRAIQSTPVVSKDGVVLSGNGRTMAGELAAQAGTDVAYLDHLRKYGQQFGFTPEQIGSMQHPRVVFVPDADMPYTTETFAKFNAQDMKGQNRTEQAVKMGKVVDDATFGRVISSINGFDTLADFYSDPKAATDAINELRSVGAINTMQYGEMFDGSKVSGTGRQMLENMLIGKAFESNPDTIRQLAEFPALRQRVVAALAEVSNNLNLGEDYSLESELAEAINLAYQALKSGYKQGEPVSQFARQLNLFPFDMGRESVADYTNATIMMLADVLNSTEVNKLKKVLAMYNHRAADSAAGQIDLFSGEVTTKEQIIKDVLEILNYGTKQEQQAAIAKAVEQRKADAAEVASSTGAEQPSGKSAGVQQNDDTIASDESSEVADEEVTPSPSTGPVTSRNAIQAAMAAAEAETNTEPTDAQKEAGNYKKGHVKIDGYDVTIEQPKGSIRRGTDASGKQWEQKMQNTYGYIRGTEGVDGDHIDVFFSDDPSQGDVFVVDQVNKDGSFDEHKVMYGFPDIESARKAYLSNYEDGWQGLGAITPVSKEEFKKWIDSSHRKTKPFAEYSSVKPLGDTQLGEQSTAGYSIKPTTYTNKKGKTTPMHLVTFGRELSKDEIRAGKELAKESRGWWDSKQGGFMMRSEESARALGEALSNADAVQDAQPLSLGDMQAATDAGPLNDIDNAIANEEPLLDVEAEQPVNDGMPNYDDELDERFYLEYLGRLRQMLEGHIPNIKIIENKIRELKASVRNLENGLATASGDTVNDAMRLLAEQSGKLRAYEQFLDDIRKKMREAERDQVLADNGYSLGEKVSYKGKPATIYDVDNGRPVLATGLEPVLYELAEWSDISKQAQVSDEEFDDIMGQLDDIFNGSSMIDFFEDSWGKGERIDIGVEMDGKTTVKHLRTLFDRFNKGKDSGFQMALADKVFALVERLNLEEISFNNDREFSFGQQGRYSTGYVRYRHSYFTHPDISDENKAHVLLHELVHACTLYAIRDYEKGGKHLSDSMKEAVQTFFDVYEQIKTDERFKGEYGISDVKEMVAEMTKPEFRVKLKAKKLWKKIVSAIERLLGINADGEVETTAYAEVRHALDYMLDNFDADAYYQYSGRRATVGNKKTAINKSTGQSGADTRSGSVSQSASHSPTATLSVSFDAAKVRNLTQKAKKNINNFINGDNPISSSGTVNQVLGNLRRFFGMQYAGNSNYVVYDTPAGRLALRLANHNARGDNFGRDNATQNISVYVALEEHEQPGSSIPFTEYRISSEDFEQHKDEFITSLVSCVGEALKTGEFRRPAYTTKQEYGAEEATPFHEDDFFSSYIELTAEQKAKVQVLGTRAAMAMIERGKTSFKDFADAMIGRLGDNIRPFLKSFYNGARDFPGFEGYEMTPYDEVRSFDVANFDKSAPDAMATAEQVVKEQEVAQQAEEGKKKLTEPRSERKVNEPKASAEDVAAIKDLLQNGKKKGGKRTATSGQQGSLFGDLVDEAMPEQPEQKPTEELAGDSAEWQERAEQERKFVGDIARNLAMRVDEKLNGKDVSAMTMRDVKLLLVPYSELQEYSTTDLQELVERAMTIATREIALRGVRGDAAAQRAAYDAIVELYNMQPLLNARDSTRVERQQYSTPTPFGYLMGMFTQAGRQVGRVLEPSAGNGALTITFDGQLVHVNDIDERRLANLRTLGYGTVTTQNGLLPFDIAPVDAVLTNPPFGTVAEREYDGGVYRLTSLEGQMVINALDSMKADGRAAIIIGGNTEYRENGVMKPKDMGFFSYLYSHYNVVDVINIDGSMYARNGTKYPVRIILIDGRKQPKGATWSIDDRVVPPIRSKARAEQVRTFDELYNRINDDILQIQQNGHEPVDSNREAPTTDRSTGAQERTGSNRTVGGNRREPVHSSGADERRVSQPSAQRSERGERGQGVSSRVGDDHRGDAGSPANNEKRSSATGNSRERSSYAQEQHGDGSLRDRPRRRPDDVRPADRPADSRARLAYVIGEEKTAYPQQSASGSLMSVVPTNQAEAITRSLSEIGDVDQFLVDELGYSSKEELYRYLAAEQIDSVALAISQMNKGKGFIIGDMTGVGKGRQGAALIRYALHQGKIPIYFTQNSSLFSDNYRDLSDIGSGGLRPFIIASKTKEGTENITDADGNIIHKLPTPKERKRVFDYILEHGTLPKEYDYVITTYSQIQAGTQDYEAKGERIHPTAKKGKKDITALHRNGQVRRDVLQKLSAGNIAILDESHSVGGDGGGAMFMQYMLQGVGGVTFLSATFAKRADNMPIYAMKTDISECGVGADEMIQAIAQGGVTLQEIMSRQLVESGQMIRRERSFQGVTIDWMPVSDEQSAVQHRQFDEVAGIFAAIRAFQDDFVKPAIDDISDKQAEKGKFSKLTQGTESLGVKNVPFASKMYNLVNQLLFALKADAVADRVIWNLEHGFKPVISFTNTMEGFLGEIEKDVPMDEMPDFSLTLLRALDGVLRYTTTDMDENSEGKMLTLSDLGDEGKAKYNEIRQRIMSLSADLPISPMDAIRIKLERAGYKVGEITGRQTELAETEDGRYVVRTRTEKDKKAAARGFNEGSIDVLMVNKSGSTGISLHSSTKFKDQRQRVMVFAQFQSDINDEVQMRGRIDRTGQVHRGKYEYIVSTIPAEQRLQMMFKSKLKSLDANTTSSQKSKFNEMEVVDFLNKYGDEVVWQYMLEHPELEERLGDPLDMLGGEDAESAKQKRGGRGENTEKKSGCAAKIARYLPFLPVAEQEEVFRDITEAYRVKIQLLNDAGENDLEITTMPLRATTKSRKVWKAGVAPDSGNAFADNTYLEEVEVDVLRKPMKASEVRAYCERLTDGKPWEQWRSEKLEEIRQHFLAKVNDTIERIRKQGEDRAAKRRDKAIEQGKKFREQGKNALTDQEIEELAQTEYSAVMQEVEKRIEAQKRQWGARYKGIVDVVEDFTPLEPLIIPVNMNDQQGSFVPSFGTFIGFKFNRDYSLSASTAVFATLDGRRKVELPLNSDREFSVIKMQTRMQSYAMRDLRMETWDSKVPTSTRKTTYIVTGNLLQALVDIQKSTSSSRGQLVTYSTIDGDVRQGILMPDSFEPTDLKQSVGINTMESQIRAGEAVESSDGNVKVENYGWQGYRISVPKSTSRGGKYFGNKKLRELVRRGEFETRGNQMVAFFDEADLKKVLNILTKDLGVSVLVTSQLTDADEKMYREDDAQAFHDVIDEMFGNEDFDKSAHTRERYDLGATPEWMKGIGISGERFTLSFKNIKTHLGKDADHNLTATEWHELPSALKHPFLVTSYGNKDGKFRLYTTIKVGDKFAVVGVDVVRVNQGKGVPMLELNRIKTVFGRDRYVVENGEKILAWDKNITPEQEALLRGHNYREYPTIQELSAANVVENSDMTNENAENVASEGGAEYREVSDEELIEWLESQPKMRKLYRSMVLIDGKLYPPMSSRESDTGSLRHPERLGYWTESQERPDLAFYDEKTGNWYFKLVKSNGKTIGKVLFNPYIHTSTTMLNDQFKEAQSRPELVVVEMEIPISELDGVYRAERAADPTGRKPWNAGAIQKYLTGTREVILSRWAKPVRIVPNDEVARHIYDMIKGRIAVMPTNVVTPQVRAELEKLGVQFVETDNKGNLVGGEHAGESWTDVYGKRNKKAKRSKKPQRADHTRAMHERAIELGQKLGVRVRLIERRSELPQSWTDRQKRRRKGWFDPSTGEVVIVVPNNYSVADVEATVLHEIVGHKGLRELFGRDFDTFLDNVFSNVHEDVRRRIVELAMNRGWDFRKATEEYLAGLAERTEFEKPENRSAWQKIKGFFMELLRKAGIRLSKPLTDADLRYVLWRSYERMSEKGALGVAEDVVMRDRLGIDSNAQERLDTLLRQWGVPKGFANYYAIDSDEAIEQYIVEHSLDVEEADDLREAFADADVAGVASADKGMVIIFNNKGFSQRRLANAIAHETCHIAYKALRQDNQEAHNRFNNAILNWFRSREWGKKFINVLHDEYPSGKWADEMMAYFVGHGVEKHGWEKFFSGEVDYGSEEITNFVARIKEIITDGEISQIPGEPGGETVSDAERSGQRGGGSKRGGADGNGGDGRGGVDADADLLFRDGDFSVRDRAVARDAYERMVSSGGYQFQEAVQDSMLGLKRLYQAVLGEDTRMEDVASNENAYVAENLMSSVNAAEQHEYYVRYMQPLLYAIGKLCGKDKAKRAAMTDYMMAKHGLERNLVLAERDAREAEAAGADYNDAYAQFRERDYAGLTALTGEADVMSAEAAARQMVAEYERDHEVGELWDAVHNANGATLEKIYRSGLLSKERYDQIQQMFDNYIPLQGWDETTSDEVYGYLTSKWGPLTGSPIKRAEGRSSKADDPIATIALMADTAIRQGNRNVMKQRFLNFALNHPSDVVSVSDLWLQHNAVTDEWEPVFADIDENDSPADVERKVEAFEERMEQLAESDPDNYKHGRDTANIPYKVVRGNLREHQVLVKRGGRTYVLTINGNPRAAQALNGLTNPDVETGGIVGNMLRGAQWVNRNLSAFYTTRNPDFVVSNFFRDMLYSNCMTWVKESPRYALRFHYNFGRVNPVVMRRLLGKWEKGTLDESNYIERMFKSFMLHGGETGYTNVKDIEGHKRTISKELKRRGSLGRRAWGVLWEQLDLLNRSAENCARFAAFVTSREMGRSMERSAYDAKEVSVNFNKKGSGGKMVNAVGQTGLGKLGAYIGGGGRLLYVFWNAGVQGMTNFARAGKHHPVKALAGAASMLTLGYVIPLLAQAMSGGGDDDDENAYYNLPEYVRRSNIIINAGDQWIAIPLPIEFRALYGLGELAYGVTSGNERYSDSELAFHLGGQVSQILPLDMLEGGGGVNPWIPSLAKPFTEAYLLNKSWSGLPVYKDTPYNKEDPEWTKAYKSANHYLVSGAQWLNEATGGDDYRKGWLDINPAKVEYLLSGTFGGAFTTIDKLAKMGETAIGSRDFEWRNMLIANRVVKSGDERTEGRKLQNEYFKYKERYEATKRLLKKYGEEQDGGSQAYAKKLEQLTNSEEYAQYVVFQNYEPLFKALHEAKGEASDTELVAIEAEEKELRREMVNLMHAVEDGGSANSRTSSDARLQKAFGSDNSLISKKAGNAIATRLGGTDSYGSSDAAYNQIYTQKRDYFDLAEDVLIQHAKKQAKDAGDDARYKALDKAQQELTTIKKGKHTKSEDVAGLGEGGDDSAIMEKLRARRKEILKEFGITQPNR